MAKTKQEDRPVSLEELEVELLSKEGFERQKRIVVEEGYDREKQHRDIRRSLRDRFIRRLIVGVFVAMILITVVALIWPDRYEIAKELVSMLLVGLSGFALGMLQSDRA